MALASVTLQSERFQAAASRRAANAEIDPVRIQRMQHPEYFGDFQRTVMREQYAAGTNANPGNSSGHSRDENLRGWTGKCFDGVVLGDPIPLVAETISRARQLDRVTESVGRREARGDGRLIEYGKLHCPLPFSLAAGKFKTLAFRGTLRAEESLFPCVLNESRFLASLGMTP